MSHVPKRMSCAYPRMVICVKNDGESLGLLDLIFSHLEHEEFLIPGWNHLIRTWNGPLYSYTPNIPLSVPSYNGEHCNSLLFRLEMF